MFDATQIDMFAKAKEIQELWDPKEGDWYEDNDEEMVLYDKYTNIEALDGGDLIFLPSIEQMAGMWHEGKDDAVGWHFFRDLYQMPIKACSILYDYPVQIIALHFIMSSLHNKRWSEEKGAWV